MPKHKHPQIFLGFDFGLRCIGTAVGQIITKTANALDVIPAKDGIPDWKQIEILIDAWQIDAFVVGLPLNMDGSEQPFTAATKRFARKLQGRFNLPVFMMDERLTTHAAKQAIKDNKQEKRKSKRADSLAAKIILESWLREQS